MHNQPDFRINLCFEALWDTRQWFEPAFVQLDSEGRILSISEESKTQEPIERIRGFAIPGHNNAHSHAFQYALAGLAENLPYHSAEDDFWSWREAMYQLANIISPEEMEDIAAMLYAEMLRHGYTAVAEFHYLHHNLDGSSYEEKAAMGQALLNAAQSTGIKLTLIPIFYQRGGFQGQTNPHQRRFISPTAHDYLDLLSQTKKLVDNTANSKLGMGIHSLRAASPPAICEILESVPAKVPRHIHVAEQQKEVVEAQQFLGNRPITWLLQNIYLGENYHLVHATHMNGEEVQQLARSKAHVVICPSTEGNLGDGFFSLRAFMQSGGRWSIGTDSHISLNPCEELRWLDYGQRLRHQKRNAYCFEGSDEGGEIALKQAILHGRAATGYSDQPLSVGEPFDAVVYDASQPLLSASPKSHRLSTIVYTSDISSIMTTLVNGRWYVINQQHLRQEKLRNNFIRTLTKIRHKIRKTF
ncbi:MAG: formimidoylglutamate deiminase [SAR324 cluster bacterium]|nr:formimidoylglutamate deiminase [SAR324 cluster bacterium]